MTGQTHSYQISHSTCARPHGSPACWWSWCPCLSLPARLWQRGRQRPCGWRRRKPCRRRAGHQTAGPWCLSLRRRAGRRRRQEGWLPSCFQVCHHSQSRSSGNRNLKTRGNEGGKFLRSETCQLGAMSQMCSGNTCFLVVICRWWCLGSRDELISNEVPALCQDKGGKTLSYSSWSKRKKDIMYPPDYKTHLSINSIYNINNNPEMNTHISCTKV